MDTRSYEVSDEELGCVSGGGIIGDFATVIAATCHAASAVVAAGIGALGAGNGSGAGSGSGSGSGSAATWPKSTWL